MKTLLLTYSYEPITFLGFRRTIKLYLNLKVDVISLWDEKIRSAENYIDFPSIIRLKQYHRIPFNSKFSRVGVFKRDMYVCQYCSRMVTTSSATLDHVIPTSVGGANSWTNCVTSCHGCNSKKGNRTPEQADMQLLNTPFTPKRTIYNDYILERHKHPDWEAYFEQR